jgi:HSP20 family molecular chaperone IbpA
MAKNVAVHNKQTGGTPNVARAVWDPFWFMRELFQWGRSADAPAFDVQETEDAYVYNVKLALPEQADVDRAKAELDNGQLTLVVPKAAAARPRPVSPPPRTRRTTGSGRGSAARRPRRGARTPSRRD